MNRRGRNLKIFLMDGSASGRWMCELSNWTGKAYKIPRTSYKKSIDREELRNPSVYFLFGYDDENGKPLVYIGETEDAIQRLGDHIKNEKKNYWVEAIVFISKDDHLNKAHIKYLESRFYEIARDIDRYEVMNSTPPKRSTVSEAEQSEMEEFIDNAKLVVSALGHKVFEPLIPIVESVQVVDDEAISDYLYLKTNKGLSATGLVAPDGFIVLKDSTINNSFSEKSLSENIVKLRKQYLSDGTVVNNVFLKDTLFSSPSAAADFILGYSASGPRSWKNSQGKSLKEINEQEN
ncbi:MAG: GIY-YIG nuclease family protein [Clostridia bacterium]|nr:GIY-YIG nuclease family protein [Clostridia bacterium]